MGWGLQLVGKGYPASLCSEGLSRLGVSDGFDLVSILFPPCFPIHRMCLGRGISFLYVLVVSSSPLPGLLQVNAGVSSRGGLAVRGKGASTAMLLPSVR